MRVDDNQGGKLHYEPNSYGEWQEQPQYREPLQKLYGDMDRWDFREDDNDYYTQPGKLFRLMSPEQQQVLYENTARNMEGVEEFIKIRHIKNCHQADQPMERRCLSLWYSWIELKSNQVIGSHP